MQGPKTTRTGPIGWQTHQRKSWQELNQEIFLVPLQANKLQQAIETSLVEETDVITV